uniref:Death domain-containing protein n=2 Tax=Amphimedon queenslandica TaxID=400682 RepID=A0A1X7SYK0_AMPQE
MEKHPVCRILARYSNRTLVLTLPQLARYLYKAELIKQTFLVLLNEVQEAVCADHRKLKAFADILCINPATAKIGRAIMRDYREAYESWNLIIEANDENEFKIYLPKSVTSEFKLMRLKLEQMFFRVGSVMMSNPQSLSIDYRVKLVLGTLFNMTLKHQLAQCYNIIDTLELVCRNTTLDDISVLEFIVNQLNVEEAKPLIKKYKEAVEEFKEMKLGQIFEEEFLYASERITIVIDEDIMDLCEDVKRLSSALLPDHVRVNIIISDGDGDSMWEFRNQRSFTDSVDKTAQTTRTVEKWLSEGSVELTVTRVNMHGPPGAGKTCAQDLLLNNPPTTHTTDSTPIARPAVKATRVSVDNEAMKWEKVDRDGLLERLASDLKEAAASQPRKEISATQHEESAFGNSSPVSTDEQQISESQDESTSEDDSAAETDEFTSERDDSATETDESTNISIESFSIGEGVIQEIVDTIQRSEVQLNLSGHWLYIIDSGGQPAYQELLPLFVRTASLNIITLDLSQPLDEKLDFQYRIGGETFSCGLNFKYSNQDFFLSAVSSGAILKPIHVPYVIEAPSHPMNFVLGTHYDLINDDKLKQMNKELMSSLKPDVENYVVPNVRGESIIFPVNTLVPEDKGRMKAGQELCQSIANCGGTSLKINVPICWFAFELWLQKVAEDKSHSFLIVDEVVSAGARFKMSEDDTKDALQYLHNVTIILYYPDILPQLVFVDPKPILEVLSRLLALTYVERKALHLIANPVPPEKDIIKLHNVGFFKAKLLKDHFKSLFSPPHFEPSHLLKLLVHLRIIASGEDGDYFFPCALQSYTEPPKPQTEIKPLLIVWQDND